MNNRYYIALTLSYLLDMRPYQMYAVNLPLDIPYELYCLT